MFCFRETQVINSEFEKKLCRALFKNESIAAAQLTSLRASLLKLWPSLAKERGQKSESKHYSFSRELTEAYAAYYLTANFLKLPFIFEEALRFGVPLFKDQQKFRIVDFGCGPGTVLWGLEYWLTSLQAASKNKIHFSYTGFDHSKNFLEKARELSASLSQVKAPLFEKMPDKELDFRVDADEGLLLCFSNSVAEIFPDLNLRKQVMFSLIERLRKRAVKRASNDWILLIEPATKVASRELLELRDSIREKEDVQVWLPCLDNRKCGALSDPSDWCHEGVAVQFPNWMQDLGAELNMVKNEALFSYLLISVGEKIESSSFPLGATRVVSQMMGEKGKTVCRGCTSQEGKVSIRVLDSKVGPENRFFLKSVRGDVFSELRLSEKGDFLSGTPFGVDLK